MEQIFQYLILSKFWFSTWQSLLTVLFSLAIGGGLAYLEDYKKINRSKLFSAVMTLPIFLPGIIVATGFIAIYGNSGYINDFLNFLGFNKINFLYSAKAIIATHIYYNFPLAYLAISARLQAKDNKIDEIAKTLGASQTKIFFTITWPRVKSTVLGTGILIFLYSFLSFSIPLVLGGIKYQTLEVYIYTLATQQLNFTAAFWLGLIQFILLSIIIIISLKYFKILEEKKINFSLNYNYKKNIIISAIKFILASYILLPIIAIIIKSWPIENYVKLFQNTSFLNSLIRSVLLALVSIIVCLLISFLILFWKKNIIGKFLVLFLSLSPVMLGIILRLLCGQNYFVLCLAYVFFLLPINYYFIASWWQSKPENFLENLAILGANNKQKIIASIHYLLPAIQKAVALSIVYIFGDLALAVLLLPHGTNTAMSLSYNLLGSYRFTLASAAMSFTLITILLLIAIIYFYDFKNRKFTS